nr:hypothetical protein [Tanacetum cinerariifolium]
MPPRRLKKKSVKRLVEKRMAKAIEEYEKTRANMDNAESSRGNSENAGGIVNVQGCSHNTFMNGKPQVFEISKCAEEDKVMFAASTFEGRTLTWWNGNVHTLGFVNANRIPWTEFKSMMTTEYCPATEIQRTEQELWTLTLKGDDIEAYNNRFHKLALTCPDLVPNEKKKGKAARVSESNKRKWEDQQGNNHHQQQNRRQETAKAYVAARAEGRGYPGTYHGAIGARRIISQNVTCFGCGEKGHYRDKCPSRQMNSRDQSSLREIDCEIS